MLINRYRQSHYLLSAHTIAQLPPDSGREVAFVGRSNVGKSSVINSITDQKRLAKTSKTPGRTRQINFFEAEPGIRLVDLPGYGYAAVDNTMREQWLQVINRYFAERESLVGLILILDIRRQPGKEDLQMWQWCREAGVPVHLLLNKADKLGQSDRSRARAAIQSLLVGEQESCQLYSVLKRTGHEELLGVLDGWLYG